MLSANDLSLLRPEARRLRRARHLSWESRVVLGLLWMNVEDECRMASAIAGTPMQVRSLIDRIFASSHPVVLRALMTGLPPTASAPMRNGYSVRCPSCHAAVRSVPCVGCASDWGERFTHESNEEPLVQPAEATSAQPGTLKKLNVMRSRISRGESCFHPDDARLVDNYDHAN